MESSTNSQALRNPTVVDAPSEFNGFSLLKFRDVPRCLGPFDGRVASYIHIGGKLCFITTNTTYVPRPPADSDTLCLRRDMRWGPDDPTCWPQFYSPTYCHFGTIPRRPTTSDANDIIWWNPTFQDFVSLESDRTLTRGLGKLSQTKTAAIIRVVQGLLHRCTWYSLSSDGPEKEPEATRIIKLLVDSLRLALERLRSIPATYERMLLGVANIQRAYLELHGLLEYMTVYKPWMCCPDRRGGQPDAETGDKIGVFTYDPAVAQLYYRARLPFWFIRPLTSETLNDVKILRVVAPHDPGESLELAVVEGFAPIPAGLTLEQRMESLHARTSTLPWYRNPFKLGQTADPMDISSVSGSQSGQTRKSKNRPTSRVKPYRPPKTSSSEERDKYTHFDHEYMASAIPLWAGALAAVNREQSPLCSPYPRNLYAFPEPALLVNSIQLDTHFYCYELIRDALLYRMGDVQASQEPLSPAQWREILRGKWNAQGKEGGITQKRTASFDRILGPALKARGIDVPAGSFLLPREGIPAPSTTRAKQITWELAEMNFRLDLCALDELVCGVDRHEECLACFPGGLVPDLSEGTLGFAAISAPERLPHLLHLARLMSTWRTNTPRPKELDLAVSRPSESGYWTSNTITDLERAVAQYYTQTFYDFYGRAAVVPLRLESGTETIIPLPNQDVHTASPEPGEIYE
ncbi:hypothetical protein K438DRAFT_1997068 [Mycena galopus ATCC 62051]|nr:hypothetical protein K438DRAFT_1997068 [Mycena galopus ATCC 62051]